MTTKTRRQKVAEHMTGAGRTPEEVAVAQAWLSENGTPLERLAEDIMSLARKSIEDEFAIGRKLNEAAAILDPLARTHAGRYAKGENGSKGTGEGRKVSESPYGDWFRSQNFPFSMKTGLRLRQAAEREGEVRAFITARVADGKRDIGVNTAMALLLAPHPQPTAEAIPVTDTTPVDPAYAALRDAYNVILKVEEGEPTGNRFDSMHIDDFVKCFEYLKAIADAWQQEKVKRAAK